MNTFAANGAFTSAFNSLSSFVVASLATFAGLSLGEGKISTIAERISFMPISIMDAPQKTGNISPDVIPFLNPFLISSGLSSLPSRYFSKSSSFFSAITSINAFLNFKALSFSSPLKVSRREVSIKSTTPLKSGPVPMGIVTSTHPFPNLSLMSSMTFSKSMFSLFILFINMIRLRLY